MNDYDLTVLTRELSMKYFGKPFQHQAAFNKRLRTTGGRYMLSTHNIEINPKHYEKFGRDELISILKHELCHYHLHIEGRGYKHSDQEFKSLLEKVGGSRYCQALPQIQSKRKTVHYYECMSCKTRYTRYRRMDTTKFVCGKCRGNLKKI
ncbi:SprT family protein [Bacillus piscicola]|uniref:SprT family protein n=1 Tax=Bacillus piscicola TaxID=1632684 RepID=UPI001F08C0B3|nr:SprT family protein [Bacillus piscicola]